jgi:hypothetical protein
LDEAICLSDLERALTQAQPEIFNIDQGGQFTGLIFTGRLAEAGIRINWGGRAGTRVSNTGTGLRRGVDVYNDLGFFNVFWASGCRR